MSEHTCQKYDEDCWRCDLNRDEMEAIKRDLRIEAEALRQAADRFVAEDPLFDHDHDNALVAARLQEWADDLDPDQ